MTAALEASYFPAMQRSEVAPALDALLEGAIDYAGLFPPAALALETAVERFGEYRASSDRWALGRFIAPAVRLEEVTALLRDSNRLGWDGARIAATIGGNLDEDLDRVVRFNRDRGNQGVAVDGVEAKVATLEAIAAFAASLPPDLVGYGEVSLGPTLARSLESLAGAGLRAKIRMGGVTVDLFPEPVAVAAFLLEVARRGLPFKATAGLHHPWRGEYRLTYDESSLRAPMYGFLNLVVATLVAAGSDPVVDRVVAALIDADPSAIRVDGAALWWRDWPFDLAAIGRLRTLFHGFGSCSFREPIDELQSLGCR